MIKFEVQRISAAPLDISSRSIAIRYQLKNFVLDFQDPEFVCLFIPISIRGIPYCFLQR